jgi:hypothetical protein
MGVKTMKLHRTRDEARRPLESGDGYAPRHLLNVPVDAESQTPTIGGSHARRLGFSVLSRMARADVASA